MITTFVMGIIEATHIVRGFMKDPNAPVVAVTSRLISIVLVGQNIIIGTVSILAYSICGLWPLYQADGSMVVLVQILTIVVAEVGFHLVVQGHYMVLHAKALQYRFRSCYRVYTPIAVADEVGYMQVRE
eukprot:NODE_23257_length_674_cov_2.466179.p2 GENE.NODE_23257_length_674_cov_2.466179~~NODE_23257_length_674_cov_2.466179.p2  ORF type:complete len:142 (+),score=34.79 NODE_23257_length_674_cov_2.466179:41-427(+)